MAYNETWVNHDMMDAVKVQYLDGNVFSQDNAGNLIGVLLTKGGVSYSGGGSVAANVIRADGVTVAVPGALSGNAASVVLPQAAYAVPGVLSIVIKLTVSGAVITIAAVVANVYQSTTDSTVDPGTIIPSVETLIAEIEAVRATIPEGYTVMWTSFAPNFSTSTSYVAGQYVTYNGGLYRFVSNHSAGSWSSSDVILVSIGSDLSALKNDTVSSQKMLNEAVNVSYNAETPIPWTWENGHIDTSTGKDIVRDANQRTIGFTPLYGRSMKVKSTNSYVVAYLYEYDSNFNFLEAHNTTTSYISPVNNSTAFVRVSTYSSSVQQSELGQAITGSWVNSNAISKNYILDQLIDSLGMIDTTISGTEGYSTNVYFPVFKDRKYFLQNNTSNSVVFNVLNSDGTFEIIETIGTGYSFTYTADDDYYGVRVYFAVTGSCSFKSIDGGVFNAINSNQDNNEELRKIVIDNGVANEYIILHDTLKKAFSIPNKSAFEIATLDGSIFETNYVTMYASDGITVLNTYNLSQYSGNKRSLTNNFADGCFIKLGNFPNVGIKVTVFTKKKQPEKIRLMQYNIGKFNYGHSGGLAEDVQEKIANYKSFLAQYQPNICGMEEYTEYIDSSSSYASDTTLFNALYYYENKDFDVELTVKADYAAKSFYNFYIKDDNNETAGSFVEYAADVKGEDLIVVAGAIAAGKAAAVRAGGFENLLKKYNSNTNVAILIDTNVISAQEHTSLVSTAESYGYKVANGGYFGSFDTYNLNSEYYHKIDNILVKGNAVLKNVIVPDVYADLSSDHYPIIADIDLMI